MCCTALIAVTAQDLLEGQHSNGLAADGLHQQWKQRLFAAVGRCWERECHKWSGRSAAFREWWTSVRLSWNQNLQATINWWKSVCPLSRQWSLRRLAFASCLENAASIGVMAVLTLNIYCATYFLAWAEHDTICLVGDDNTFSDDLKRWVKVITVGLPFAVCPVTLYIAGQAKVIFEYVYILLIGALMTICMSASPYQYVGPVTGILIDLVLVTWGCCCYHPKCLRRWTVWKCCCHEIDLEAPEIDDESN